MEPESHEAPTVGARGDRAGNRGRSSSGSGAGRAAAIEVLSGGITNRNFKVDAAGGEYVLRIGGLRHGAARDRPIGRARGQRDRRGARHRPRGGGVGGAGGLPRHALHPRHPGERRADARPRDDPQRGADAAALPQQRLDRCALRSFPRGRGVPSTATAHRMQVPKAYDRAKPIADMIERLRPPHPTVFCHNDLLNANFIADENGRIWIVDWEYAGWETASSTSRTSPSTTGSARRTTPSCLRRTGSRTSALVQMRFMSDFREAMWGVVQQAISTSTSTSRVRGRALRADGEDGRLDRFRRALL